MTMNEALTNMLAVAARLGQQDRDLTVATYSGTAATVTYQQGLFAEAAEALTKALEPIIDAMKAHGIGPDYVLEGI